MDYRFEMDDPYKILAHLIVGYYRPADVLRILEDDEYLATLVQKETRLADIGGWFLDCIIEDVLSQKKRMEYMHELDKLAQYYFDKLNKPRLRKEIRLALGEAGIFLVDSRESL